MRQKTSIETMQEHIKRTHELDNEARQLLDEWHTMVDNNTLTERSQDIQIRLAHIQQIQADNALILADMLTEVLNE